MSVRMKLSHSKTASRRAHHRVGVPRLVSTPTGHRRRHFVDPTTGMYRGKQIITVGEAAGHEHKHEHATEKKSASAKKQEA